MTLTHVLIFTAAAFLYRLLPSAWRAWTLLIGSLVAIYLLQPALPLPPMDYALPTLTLTLALIGWWLTRPPEAEQLTRDDLATLGVTVGAALIIALIGTLDTVLRLTPSPTPPFFDALLAFVGIGIVLTAGQPLVTSAEQRKAVIPVFITILVGLFVVLKSAPLTDGLAAWLRANADRPLTVAGALDLGWLGFSYVAFRLIHTLRDRQSGKLPALSLREYLTYLIFFPAYTAGPIDRAERFVKDYRALPLLDARRATEGLGRIAAGILKKFVVADTLALIALDPLSASRAETTLGLWLLVYAYAFRLYLDFSGYSDIAIGIGKLYGTDLPENFALPYLKSNITAFWQSWHITLSNWARFYVFMPLSRYMVTRKRKPPTWLAVLIGQLGTMLTIGLWHGIALNFVIWAVWHGVGLWLHKQYSDRTRDFYASLNDKPTLRRIVYIAGVLITFHYVAIGWVWFALSDAGQGMQVFRRLFGVGW
ncbi:MAG: MBOAT family O-acyltransferase [Anaerolineae bacterium]|nr:MBOAT family O-acyltransferase [Anaerolineae bacterium]